jgi:hypothetical protein
MAPGRRVRWVRSGDSKASSITPQALYALPSMSRLRARLAYGNIRPSGVVADRERWKITCTGLEPSGLELAITRCFTRYEVLARLQREREFRPPCPDRGTASFLRRYRRIIYDAFRSSSPFSKSEAAEKYDENQTGARERNRNRVI